jgi:hypothetical protein
LRRRTEVEIVRAQSTPAGAPGLPPDPLEFLAPATSYIPLLRQHQLKYYGAYAPPAGEAVQNEPFAIVLPAEDGGRLRQGRSLATT